MNQHVRINKDGATLLEAPPLPETQITDAAQIRNALARITYTVHFHDERTGEMLTFEVKQLRAGEGILFWRKFCTPKVMKAIDADMPPDELAELVKAETGLEDEVDIIAFFQDLKPKVIAECMVDATLQDVDFWCDVDKKWVDLLYDVITDSLDDSSDLGAEISRLTAALASAQKEIATLKERIAELEETDDTEECLKTPL